MNNLMRVCIFQISAEICVQHYTYLFVHVTFMKKKCMKKTTGRWE